MTATKSLNRDQHAAEILRILGQAEQVGVSISGYHGGQIVTPSVDARRAGRNKVRVALSWYDASDQTYSTPEIFSGTVSAAEKWLAKQGVRLDAQGIRW